MFGLESQQILDAAPSPIVTIDYEGQILYANSSACECFGRDRGDLLHDSIFDLFSGSGLADVVNNARSHGTVDTLESQDDLLVYDMQRIVQVKARDWKSADGQGLVTFIFQDVTKKRLEETQLRSTLDRWDSALTGAQIGIFEIDLRTGRSIVSETWKTMMGVAEEPDMDWQAEWRARVHPEDIASVQESDRACIEGRIERSLTRYRLRNRQGSGWSWMCSDAVAGAKDESGRALRLIGTQTDVTELKAAEDELKRSVGQFQSLFENAPIGKAIITTDGRLAKVNAAFCDLFGYSEEDLLWTSIERLTHPKDITKDADMFRSIASGDLSSYRIEKRFLRSDGSDIWGLLSVAAMVDSNGSPERIISQIVDLTEHRKTAELKREFVATASHELRTPLTSILGAFDLLFEVISDDMPREAGRLIHIAKTNAKRLRHLVDDILDFEKMAAGEMKYKIASHEIRELLEESVIASQAQVQEFGVRFNISSPDAVLDCQIDPGRFQQVISNLLSNAVKFSDPDTEIKIQYEVENSFVRVSVSNTGEPIPKYFQNKLFEPFSQVPTLTTKGQNGTGLGLSICKKIVEKMGGEIGFENVDRTTTFWFTVPIANSSNEVASRI